MKIVWLSLVFSFSLFAQTDWQRWQKSEINYTETVNDSERSYSLHADDPFEFLLKTAAVTYWFFISDVDGDNCPFDPSCSSFFLESVKASNIFEGTLMFADRFTRDFNVFNRSNYRITNKRRLADPPEKYLLSTVRPKVK
ncbi:MAG: membrane protein insertion efficiency factor YidD [Ignavibacteria bacterium]|nr:membrane protein insertion efficiency factor YidD [Ignavibacteria bacterium]